MTFAGPKKTVLILPGSGVNSAKEANGMCKVVEKMLPEDRKDDYQICSLYYDNSYTMFRPTVIRAEKIFDEYIVPLIATKDANGDLHRLSAQQAAHNLRNLTVVTHCYGGYIMQEMDKLLKRTMEDLGYLGGEQSYIHRQLFVVQHNNIDEDLGCEDFGSTNLIRISAADEKTWRGEMLEDSFRFYAETNKIQEQDMLYLSVSENTRVLWADRITKDGRREHNGGYWLSSIYKTEAGKTEEQLFQTIFTEAVTTDKMIDSMEQIIRDAVQKKPEQRSLFNKVMRKGKDFSNRFKQYSQNIRQGFAKLKDKLMNGQAASIQPMQEPVSAIFAEDRDGKFLLDYAIEKGAYDLAEKLVNCMASFIPAETCMSQCRNQMDADSRRGKWAQQALDANQPALLKAVRTMSEKFLPLNYEKADEKTLTASAQILESFAFPNTLSAQEEYCKYMVDLYAKSKQIELKKDINEPKQIIENNIFDKYKEDFARSAYARNKINHFCTQIGDTELSEKVNAQWGSDGLAGKADIGKVR
ncbi:MAG: hypothetical protein J6Y91_05490 [Alphaproteobacteria bacterium]|nr:hypothetical protein [Alphaproteobacteria bacterium]